MEQEQQQQQQILDDQRLAKLLQDAEFVQALRRDQEFMDSLATEHEARQPDARSSHPVEIKPVDEEAAFRERLRQMGKG